MARPPMRATAGGLRGAAVGRSGTRRTPRARRTPGPGAGGGCRGRLRRGAAAWPIEAASGADAAGRSIARRRRGVAIDLGAAARPQALSNRPPQPRPDAGPALPAAPARRGGRGRRSCRPRERRGRRAAARRAWRGSPPRTSRSVGQRCHLAQQPPRRGVDLGPDVARRRRSRRVQAAPQSGTGQRRARSPRPLPARRRASSRAPSRSGIVRRFAVRRARLGHGAREQDGGGALGDRGSPAAAARSRLSSGAQARCASRRRRSPRRAAAPRPASRPPPTARTPGVAPHCRAVGEAGHAVAEGRPAQCAAAAGRARRAAAGAGLSVVAGSASAAGPAPGRAACRPAPCSRASSLAERVKRLFHLRPAR